MKEDSLWELHHPHDTNHLEAFKNKFITKFLPNEQTPLYQMIENKARIYLAMSIQSIGYQCFYRRLFTPTGIRPETEFAPLYLGSEDNSRKWFKLYRKTSVKISQMQRLEKS
jgi:hypothetical protein